MDKINFIKTTFIPWNLIPSTILSIFTIVWWSQNYVLFHKKYEMLLLKNKFQNQTFRLESYIFWISIWIYSTYKVNGINMFDKMDFNPANLLCLYICIKCIHVVYPDIIYSLQCLMMIICNTCSCEHIIIKLLEKFIYGTLRTS